MRRHQDGFTQLSEISQFRKQRQHRRRNVRISPSRLTGNLADCLYRVTSATTGSIKCNVDETPQVIREKTNDLPALDRVEAVRDIKR